MRFSYPNKCKYCRYFKNFFQHKSEVQANCYLYILNLFLDYIEQIRTRNITIPRGLYDGLAFTPAPPLVLVAFSLVPSPCPLESPPLIDIDLHYK